MKRFTYNYREKIFPEMCYFSSLSKNHITTFWWCDRSFFND